MTTRSERIRKYMAHGYGVVMMTYRGFGGSGGRPSEEANVSDALDVYEAVRASGIPAAAIVVYGESLGSGVAVQLAAQKEVGGLILDAPYTSIVDLAALHYPHLPARWLMTDRYETLKVAGKVTAPALIVHGEADDIIPVSMSAAVATPWAARSSAPHSPAPATRTIISSALTTRSTRGSPASSLQGPAARMRPRREAPGMRKATRCARVA